MTYTLHKEYFQLYAEIQDSVAVNSCQASKKYIALLSDTAVILCGRGSRTGVKDRYVKFTLSADTYFIDKFNAKN